MGVAYYIGSQTRQESYKTNQRCQSEEKKVAILKHNLGIITVNEKIEAIKLGSLLIQFCIFSENDTETFELSIKLVLTHRGKKMSSIYHVKCGRYNSDIYGRLLD